MFFFFIGGIQPKTVIVDKNLRICPKCGLNRATLKRTDHYLTIFFIPLFRLKKGELFLECPSCGPVIMDKGPAGMVDRIYIFKCPACNKEVLPEYRFCPFCGKGLK